MMSLALLFYCLIGAGAYLLVLSLLLDYLEHKMKLSHQIPSHLVEPAGLGASLVNFMMEFLFFVAIPTFVYSFFYFLIPLSGIKAGLAAALFAFVLGAAPAIMGLSVRVKLPMPYLSYMMLSLLFKLGGSLTVIAYLYSL
ncbi:MAG: hypothetical protein GY867_06095 [bacterium]|nr:hypothetical protein [bacterium]